MYNEGGDKMQSNPDYLFRTRGISWEAIFAGAGESVIDTAGWQVECADAFLKTDNDLIEEARLGSVQVDASIAEEMRSSIEDEPYFQRGNHTDYFADRHRRNMWE